MNDTLKIPAPNYKRRVLVNGNQTTKEIAAGLLIAERDSRIYWPFLRTAFLNSDKLKTCKRIFDYCRQNIEYKKETANDQTVRTVNRIIKEGKTKGADCKHFAILCVSACLACNIPAWFRLVSYSTYNPDPTHVYCIARVGGVNIAIDPVLSAFDTELQYNFVYNVKPLN